MGRWDITDKIIMKKYILIFIAMVCFVVSLNAKERYQVTVTVWQIYTYWDDNNKIIGEEQKVAQAQIFDKCAETADQARENACERIKIYIFVL